ncbi:brorin-like isoform X2 [Physella acuta]|uniref:brorin-like isoform X1 n=1 Tax=Physella acuta TaxID=109671 RepID=UPI0027DC54A1|nr:brorin-like isoform X1 [Physella acuta]XP_059149065.1 brorin-like isoform X2 [Physella acuta]
MSRVVLMACLALVVMWSVSCSAGPVPVDSNPEENCENVVCPEVPCTEPVQEEGACCKTCPAGCNIFDAFIPVGERHYFEDGMYCDCESEDAFSCVL